MLDRLRAALRPGDLERRLRALEAAERPDVDELRLLVDRSVHEATSLNEAVLVRRIEALAASVDQLRDDLREGLAERLRHTEAATAAVQEAAVAAAREHTEAAVEVSARMLNRRIDNIRRSQSMHGVPMAAGAAPAPARAVGGPSAGGPPSDPALYVSLEDRFRGDPAMIEERQVQYVPYLEGVVDADHPLLDVGSGRGEWLGILAGRGLPATGVDSNPMMVAECREAGLEVVEADLMEHLSALRPASLGAVTMFHVVEHLPFDVLIAALRQVARVLRPGGVLIAETPNALNLRVAASTFWIDPTHERPLHPEVLVFLASECGFTDVDRLFLNRLGDVPDLTDLPEGAAAVVRRLVEDVDGPGDFALVARTGSEGDEPSGT